MRKFQVRIDACFIYEVEADNVDDAQAIAEEDFECDDAANGRITETLVFEEDGVTTAEDEESEDA